MEIKAKILANDGISEIGKQKLETAGFYVSVQKVEQDRLAEVINKENYEVLLVRSATKVRKALIDACPNLKLIGRGGVGLDNIDVQYAEEKGITVINTPGASSQSVAELTIAHMFTLARFLYDSNRQMPVIGESNFKELKKKYGKGIELRNKTLGIIGFGRIGQCVAEYALGLGMKVMAYDPFIERATINLNINGTAKVQIGIVTSSLNEILQNADFITVHVPKQENGNAVIGEEQFQLMKDGVFVINTARGGIIDEKALIKYLDNGKVAAAALDVFENEPTPNSDLLTHPKISLSPHIGAATIEAQDRIGEELAAQIITFFKKLKR
ncbi:MAG: 3-phosphoglycerate dehydrogenase [Bacteroidetes bacterium]|nr:MAG: 3-phosphoglycerate dehydrogenase [Bacteroidota bacterium]